MRGSIVAEKPGSGGLTGDTLTRTPRTPSLLHFGKRGVGLVLLDVDNAPRSGGADLAHGIEHAGIVAAIGARLNEHKPLHAEQPGELPNIRRAAPTAGYNAASR